MESGKWKKNTKNQKSKIKRQITNKLQNIKCEKNKCEKWNVKSEMWKKIQKIKKQNSNKLQNTNTKYQT